MKLSKTKSLYSPADLHHCSGVAVNFVAAASVAVAVTVTDGPLQLGRAAPVTPAGRGRFVLAVLACPDARPRRGACSPGLTPARWIGRKIKMN